MTSTLLPNGEQQFIDSDGKPYAGGFVYFYLPNTTTLKDTFQDPGGLITNTNPVVLDAAGRGVMLGTGDYRQILYDSAMNLIWDQLTSAPLPDSAISSVMAPVVAAATLQQARDLMGVTAAISAAITNVQLEPGPTGPQGVQGIQGIQGIQGPTGPTGPAGGGGGGGTNGGVQCGIATSGLDGIITITFSTAFATNVARIGLTMNAGPGGPAPAGPTGFFGPTQLMPNSLISADRSGFSTLLIDADGNPLGNFGVSWYALGY